MLPPFRPRRRTIRRQLLAIVLVPCISLIAVAMGVTTYLALQARDSSSLQKTVKEASGPAGAVILGLQQERRLSLTELAGAGDTGLDDARAQVDTGLAGLADIIGPLASSSDSTSVQQQIGSLTEHGDDLKQLRAGIDAGQVDITTAYTAYSEMIAGFGASLRTATQEAPDAASAYDQLTSVDLFYGAESLWRSVTLTEVAIQSGELPDALVEEYHERSGAYHAQLSALAAILPGEEKQQLDAIMAGDSWQQITDVQAALDQRLARPKAEAENWPPVGLAQWRATMNDVGAQVAQLYSEHSTAAARSSEATVHAEETRAWVVGAVLLMVGLIVVLIAVRMSGRVAQRLRHLRDDTRRLSGTRLPSAVKELRQGQEPTVAISPLKHGDDEIGEVAQAFNEAQETAVRAAADEAKARAGTRDVFLNIARRTQGIAYQQLKLLDQAQEHVEDPNHLKLLFQLDHLATRARRHAENLVILGGKQPGRRWSRPVPLIDVVRGATGETVNYEQVVTRRVPEVQIVADRAADVIHILAELIDNATSFGPPASTVEVRGEIVGKGVALEIEDRGLGMTDEQRDQLNRMLGDVPDFGDMALSADTRLGLFVVGRLAARNDIRVTLRESVAYGGTIAVVLLPTSVLTGPITSLSMNQVFPASLSAPRPVSGVQET